MQFFLKRLAILAIVLVQAAEALAATDPAASSRKTQQIPVQITTYAEQNSRPVCEREYSYDFSVTGVHSHFELRDLPYIARIDARYGKFNDSSKRRKKYANIVLSGGTTLCWIGGHISNSLMMSSDKQARISDVSAFVIQEFHQNADISIFDLVIEGGSGGISVSGDIEIFLWERGYIGRAVKSCISLDGFFSVIVNTSLFDGCEKLLKVNINSDHGEVVLYNNIIRIENFNNNDMNFLELDFETDVSIKMYNNVILFDGTDAYDLNYVMNDLLKNVKYCGNNIFILPEMWPIEEIDSECGLITYDKTIWEEAKAAWLDLYSDGEPRFDTGEVDENATPSREVPDRIETLRSSHELDAIEFESWVTETRIESPEARDPVSDSRRSAQETMAAAQRAVRVVDSFLGRWSDESFWLDGTGWVD